MSNTTIEEFAQAVGRRVRLARHTARLTQAELAVRCNLDRTHVGAVERGTANPSLEVLWRLANALDTSVRDLIPPDVDDVE